MFTRPGSTLVFVCWVAAFFGQAGGARAESGSTLDNTRWTERVSFRPRLVRLPSSVGEKVDRTNLQHVGVFLPDGLKTLISKYHLELALGEYTAVHPSIPYIQATVANLGKSKPVDPGPAGNVWGLSGYQGGLPFPAPQNALEVAWNMACAYRGDDSLVQATLLSISAARGVERKEEVRFSWISTLYRTDVLPRPALPGFADKKISRIFSFEVLAPPEKKGFRGELSELVWPENSPKEIHLPPWERVIRGSLRAGDVWNATDWLYGDLLGFDGHPERMHWKLSGKGTYLLPVHAGLGLRPGAASGVVAIGQWPHWNPRMRFEPRPVYLLEAWPRLSDHPYGREVFYVDAETFLVICKEAYDRQGALQKVFLYGFNGSSDLDRLPLDWAVWLAVDLASEHATVLVPLEQSANSGRFPPGNK